MTAYYGKYLNRYSGDHVPAGWSRWAGLVRNSRYYNYTLNIDGKLEHHGDRYETDYLPDLITNKTLALIREMEDSSSPFMAVLGEFLFCGCINNYMLILTLTYEIFEGYPAPHGPEDSAPQHQKLFLNTTTHHTPGTMGLRRLFFPAQVCSIQFARDVEFSIFAEAERLV